MHIAHTSGVQQINNAVHMGCPCGGIKDNGGPCTFQAGRMDKGPAKRHLCQACFKCWKEEMAMVPEGEAGWREFAERIRAQALAQGPSGARR